jgi:nucleotide-binding universal stress UspA family protein
VANPNKVGLVIGALIGGWHFVWSLLVGIGWAQPILDFIFWAHMTKPIYFVKPFDAVAAVALIVITAVIGYLWFSRRDYLESIAASLTRAQKMGGFWQLMPSPAVRESSWYRMKRPSIRNILVPIDFSKLSIHAIKTARQLARRFPATIHIAHVRRVDYATAFSAPSPPIAPFPLMTYDEDAEKRVLQELNGLACEHGISSASCHVVGGGPAFDEICRLAQKIPADLIVMPTHGRTGLKHVFLGSTAERFVRHSPCPVLVVRERRRQSKTEPRLTVKRILVPVDFSECSQEGLQYAIGFANEFGARVILVHATYLGYIYSSEGNAIYDVRGLQEAARENAERQMRELVRAVKAEGIKLETAITEGSPVLDICALAKDHDVDLIIISTHGLTGLQHVLIGSIAEKVMRHASCSVLVVPSHPQIRAANLAKMRAFASQQQPRKSSRGKALTKKDRKIAAHAFPEQRKTNKFRESHFSR